MINTFILLALIISSAISIVVLLNISKKGKEGSKGITDEYTSEAGVKEQQKETDLIILFRRNG